MNFIRDAALVDPDREREGFDVSYSHHKRILLATGCVFRSLCGAVCGDVV